MKKFIFFIAALATMSLASCGGGNEGENADSTNVEEAALEPKEVAVTTVSEAEGTFGELVTLSDGTFTVNFTPEEYIKGKYSGNVSIPMTVKQLEELTADKFVGNDQYKLIFLDANGSPLSETFSLSDVSAFENALKAAGDTKVTVKFTGSYIEAPEVENIVSKAKSAKLSVSGELRERASSSNDLSSAEAAVEGDAEAEDLLSKLQSASSEAEIQALLKQAGKLNAAAKAALDAYGKTKISSLVGAAASLSNAADAIDALNSMSNGDYEKAAKAAANALGGYVADDDDDDDDDSDW